MTIHSCKQDRQIGTRWYLSPLSSRMGSRMTVIKEIGAENEGENSLRGLEEQSGWYFKLGLIPAELDRNQ